MAQPLSAYRGSDPYVFVSYSHADEDAVFPEIRWLQDQGVNVWYDTTGIGPGSEWNDEIARAIKDADPFVYLVTPRSVASEHCRREVNFAQSEDRRVVTVHLEETELPDGLRLALENRQAVLKYRLSTLEYRIALLQSLAPGGYADTPVTEPPRRSGKRSPSLGYVVAGLVAGVLLGGLVAFNVLQPTTEPARQIRFVANAEPAPQAFSAGNSWPALTLARDGSRLVYVGFDESQWHIYVRALSTLATYRLEGTEGAMQPFLSPDDDWVGFYDPSTNALKKVSVLGGPVTRIGNAPGALGGATWGPDGTIVFSMLGYPGLYRVPAAGGEYEVLSHPDAEEGEVNHHWPHFLPGGQEVAFSIYRRSGLREPETAILSLDTGRWKTVLPEGQHARYAESGHLVYTTGDAMRAVTFDLDRLETVGTPIQIADESMQAAAQGGSFALSNKGSIAFFLGSKDNKGPSLSWINRDGAVEVEVGPSSTSFYLYPRISPDGRLAAFDLRHAEDDIWIWDFDRRGFRQLTFDPGRDRYPVWSADNRWVFFYSSRGGSDGIYRKQADGSGEPQKISSAAGLPISASRDGRYLIYRTTSPEGTDLHLMHLDDEWRSEGLLTSESNELNAEISPNGRWLAYQDDPSGEPQIYVRPFPALDGGMWKISVAGGTQPVWSDSGQEIFFVSGARMMSARAHTEAGFGHEEPRQLFSLPNAALRGIGRIFDVARDGERFLVNVFDPEEDDDANQIVIVTDWLSGLERPQDNP